MSGWLAAGLLITAPLPAGALAGYAAHVFLDLWETR